MLLDWLKMGSKLFIKIFNSRLFKILEAFLYIYYVEEEHINVKNNGWFVILSEIHKIWFKRF